MVEGDRRERSAGGGQHGWRDTNKPSDNGSTRWRLGEGGRGCAGCGRASPVEAYRGRYLPVDSVIDHLFVGSVIENLPWTHLARWHDDTVSSPARRRRPGADTHMVRAAEPLS
jgi:hypothetical protein